jgi:hypothetical protein
MNDYTRVKIVTFVPVNDAEKVRKALGDAGAGRIGEYSYCSYSVKGVGRFRPSGNANPATGENNKINAVEEERIEVVCERSNAKVAIAALKSAHPYEEVAFDICPVLEESQL